MKYDADREPNAETWLNLDESEQLAAVLRYHKGSGLKGERAQLHAVIHTAIESQLAGGLDAVRRALDRLMAEGLTRHEAVHAIGMPFSEQLLTIMKELRAFDAEKYERDLGQLTAASWRAMAEDE